MKESGQTGMHHRTAAGGFTLVELMITIVVLAILVMLAGPSFRDAIDRYRVTKTANDLISSIYFARAEAMRTGSPVNVAPIGGNWSQGWQVINPNLPPGSTVLQESSVPYAMQITAVDGGGVLLGVGGLSINIWGRNGAASFRVEVASGNPVAVRCVNSSAGGGIDLSAYGCP